MVDPGLLKKYPVAAGMLANFDKTGWPGTVLFTGRNSLDKQRFIRENARQRILERLREDGRGVEFNKSFLEQGEHPDYYEFKDSQIAIGDPSSPEPGTVRHLLRHITPYRSRYSEIRFVFIPEAAGLRAEAESALLKSLEEPGEDTVFLLSADDASELTDTISSRAIQVPMYEGVDPEKVSPDPWLRFWYLSGIDAEPVYSLIKEKEFDRYLQDRFDRLSGSEADFRIFLDIFWSDIQSRFAKEKIEQKTAVTIAALDAVYFSLRDYLCEGSMPTVGPVRLPFKNREAAMKLKPVFERFHRDLDLRIFGTRSLNMRAVVFSFLGHFMPLYTRACTIETGSP